MTTQSTQGEIRPQITQTLFQQFESIERSFAMVSHEIEQGQVTGSALVCLECDAEELVALVHDLRGQLRGESSDRKSGYTAEPRKVSIDEVLAMQAAERGIEPMALEADLLIKRVQQGGHSGQFLADAYLSAYRGLENFSHALKELIRLDAEAFRLFHQILHIRHVPGWNDATLYQIEQQVIAAVKVGGAV